MVKLTLLRGSVEETFAKLKPAKRIKRVHSPIPSNYKVVHSYQAGYNNMAEVRILYNPETEHYMYHITEPEVTDVIENLYDKAIETIQSMEIVEIPPTIEERERLYEKLLLQALQMIGFEDAYVKYPALRYYIIRDIVGYGIIDVPMRDPHVEEVDYSNPDHVLSVVVRGLKVDAEWLDTNIKLEKQEIFNLIQMLASKAGKAISESDPLLEARLPEGHRLAANLEEVGRSPAFTIRKHPENPLSLTFLVANGTMSSLMAAYLWTIVEHRKFVVVIGEMGSGKTTVLQALTSAIPSDAKIVTLEDTPELKLVHPRWQALYTRYSTGGTVKNIDLEALARYSLRTRGQYVFIGEVRGREMYYLVQLVATGHGALTTFHAEDPVRLILRMRSPPLNVEDAFLVTITSIVLQRKVYLMRKKMHARRTTNIWEITGFSKGGPLPVEYREIFRWDPLEDKHYPDDIDELIDKSYWIKTIAKATYGDEYWRPFIREELRMKKQFIEYLVRNNVLDYKTVTNEIYKFRLRLRRKLADIVAKAYGISIKK